MSELMIKPSAMIQMVNVLSKMERISYNYLINKARKSKEDGPWIIPLSELEHHLGITRNNRPFLMDMLASMVLYPIQYDVLGKDGNTVWKSHSSLFSMMSFSLDGHMVRYEFASDILAHIRNPSMYAKFNIEDQMRIKSSAAIALYEYFHDVLGGKRDSVTQALEFDTVRLLLDWQDKYSAFKEFNRQLNAAVSQINHLGVIEVNLTLNKLGRKPVNYSLNIKKSLDVTTSREMIKEMLK